MKIKNRPDSVDFLQIQILDIFCKNYYFYKMILTNLVIDIITEQNNSVLLHYYLINKKFSNKFQFLPKLIPNLSAKTPAWMTTIRLNAIKFIV